MTRLERSVDPVVRHRGKKILIAVLIVLAVAAGVVFALVKTGIISKEPALLFSKKSTDIYAGYSETLKIKKDPSDADLPKIKWSSSDNKTAKVDSKGNVDAVSAGTATITATSEKGQELSCKVTVLKPVKTIYFTFDDGPSSNVTPKLLKLLKDSDVRATFFIVGYEAADNPKLVKECSDNGNCIAVHTYSHNYRQIYASKAAYMTDFNKTSSLLKSITGKNPSICRMPGGSNNSFCPPALGRQIIAQLRSGSIKVVDWNVSYGDSSTKQVPASILVSRVKAQVKTIDEPVILAHDSSNRDTSYEATKILIKYFKDNHYAFGTLDEYGGKLPVFLGV